MTSPPARNERKGSIATASVGSKGEGSAKDGCTTRTCSTFCLPALHTADHLAMHGQHEQSGVVSSSLITADAGHASLSPRLDSIGALTRLVDIANRLIALWTRAAHIATLYMLSAATCLSTSKHGEGESRQHPPFSHRHTRSLCTTSWISGS